MRNLRSILAVFTTALRRLSANALLALCALLALTAAVALSVSVPVYAEAASLRLLNAELRKQEQRTGRSAFALLFRYVAAWNGPLEWEQAAQADAFLSDTGVRSLELPIDGIARHARTEPQRLFLPPSGTGENQFLKNVPIGFITGLEGQIRIVDGSPPRPAAAGEAIDVMISRSLADELGLNVGERLVLVSGGSRPAQLALVIAAVWEPINARDPAWFFQPDNLKDLLLTAEQSYAGPIAETLRGEVGQTLWYIRLNGAGMTAAEAAPLLARIDAVRTRAATFVPGLRLEQSPADALERYRQNAEALTLQLAVFSVPILGLTLYFTSLVATLLVNRQRGEIALLKTRGVRDGQILGTYLVEWLILGALAVSMGPTLGLMFAELMGRTESFLRLADRTEALALALTPSNLLFGLGAVGVTILAALIPAFAATRRTLVDEQRQAARVLRPPFWQRFYLDVLLLIPPLYGIYQLQQSGGLQLGGMGGADPFSNPLLILVPLLLCFALGLFVVRIVPLLAGLLERLFMLTNMVVPLVALRSLARQPGTYRGPLLLLLLTLSLAAFSSSMAATIDGALHLAVRYQVGAQAQLFETGETARRQGGNQPGIPNPPGGAQDDAQFVFVPVSEHLAVPGILAATRVGVYEAGVQVGAQNKTAQVIGIDRLDFPKVIQFFDRRWAEGQPLGALMNLLARNRSGVIVSRDLLAGGRKVGDALPLTLRIGTEQREVRLRILAVVDLWPGFYPQNGPIVVANLDAIFDEIGGQYPYDVWITRDPAVEINQIVTDARTRGIQVIDAIAAETILREEQARPQRQGLFGVLSVGFIAAGALTLLGFLLAGLINARRKTIELGVLRALGLRGSQVVLILVIEQVLLVAAGIGAGTGIGLLVAMLVVPLMQVGAGPYPGTPAYAAQIAWSDISLIYLIFALALMLTLLALIISLSRMQLFQAVKLGDAN